MLLSSSKSFWCKQGASKHSEEVQDYRYKYRLLFMWERMIFGKSSLNSLRRISMHSAAKTMQHERTELYWQLQSFLKSKTSVYIRLKKTQRRTQLCVLALSETRLCVRTLGFCAQKCSDWFSHHCWRCDFWITCHLKCGYENIRWSLALLFVQGSSQGLLPWQYENTPNSGLFNQLKCIL